MAVDRGDTLRDWHRLFGLLLTDFFTDSPFAVEVERDVSQQQQFLDVVILRRGRGRFSARLPDGLGDLVAHNLITFKSHHEALEAWTIKELVGYYVPYRKLVSRSPTDLSPEDQFRLYAVSARLPRDLPRQVPWHERQPGVYDCHWGTDVVRVIVAGQLPQEPQNAPLHLFSAAPELVGFGRSSYQRRSEHTSGLLRQLLESYQGEDLVMPYTLEDFARDYAKRHFPQLTPAERREVLLSLPPEEQQEMLQGLPPDQRLAGLSAEQIREYLEKLTASRPKKPRRKK